MIKDLLKKWLFKSELGLLKREAELNKAIADELANQEADHRKLSVRDLVFKNLEGFDPHHFDGVEVIVDNDGHIQVNGDVFEDAKKIGVGEEDLLSQAKDLAKNRALPVIINHLIRNQILMTFRGALSVEQANFGRAVVTGYEGVRDEVERLEAIYDDRHKGEEGFDKHAVV